MLFGQMFDGARAICFRSFAARNAIILKSSGFLRIGTFPSISTYDPANTSFGPLRVFNDDRIAPSGGFPLHPHREMEIVTYVIEGQIEHHDTLGNRGVVSAGEIQRMSAGTGIRHSEFNPSSEKSTHMIQLWLLPSTERLAPSWEQKRYPAGERVGKLLPVALPAGSEALRENAVRIHRDASIYTSLLGPGQSASHTLAPGRRGYIFVIDGKLHVNGETLEAGDQLRMTDEAQLRLSGPTAGTQDKPADFLLLDLP